MGMVKLLIRNEISLYLLGWLYHPIFMTNTLVCCMSRECGRNTFTTKTKRHEFYIW
ncbi:Uncharacterised protein [Porphyromonas cangingivalis]|nr:Uncharacterised protein [Porphyromonas cangingivalis]